MKDIRVILEMDVQDNPFVISFCKVIPPANKIVQ